jgi:hypothetical protein
MTLASGKSYTRPQIKSRKKSNHPGQFQKLRESINGTVNDKEMQEIQQNTRKWTKTVGN